MIKTTRTRCANCWQRNAVWEAKGFGKFEGRDLIAEKLAAIGREMIVWSLHFPVSPIIDIAEDLTTAHAFWVAVGTDDHARG